MESYNSHFMSQQMSQSIFPSNDNSSPSTGVQIRNQKGKSVEPTIKANWDARNTEVFIRLCFQEVNNGNRPGTHFNKVGWNNLVRNFALATNHKYSKMQLKNKWDSMKKEWGQWKSLTRGETGLGWNHDRGTVDATPEWWQRKIQANHDAAKFREKGPLLVLEQGVLFSDVVANGTSSWTPSAGIMPPHMQDDHEPYIPNTNSMEDIDVDIPPVNMTPSEPRNLDGQPEGDATQQDSDPGQPNQRKSIQFLDRIKKNKARKLNTADSIARCMARIVDNMENPNPDATGPFSIPSCLEILETLPGIDENGALWMYATRVFLRSEIRVLFISLKKNEQRLRWLEQQMARDMELQAFSNISTGGSHGVESTESGRGISG